MPPFFIQDAIKFPDLVHAIKPEPHYEIPQANMKGRTNYFPNSLGGGFPTTAPEDKQGYVHYPEKTEGRKIRSRSEGFKDFYSQATLFWNSMSDIESNI